MNYRVLANTLGALLFSAMCAAANRPTVHVELPSRLEHRRADLVMNIESYVDVLATADGDLPENITVRVQDTLRTSSCSWPLYVRPGHWDFSLYLAPEDTTTPCDGYGHVALQYWSSGLPFLLSREWLHLNCTQSEFVADTLSDKMDMQLWQGAQVYVRP